MSQNMKTMLPNTKFYNFNRKFWQVTALSWTFFLGGGEISLGGRPPLPHLGTAPGCSIGRRVVR